MSEESQRERDAADFW